MRKGSLSESVVWVRLRICVVSIRFRVVLPLLVLGPHSEKHRLVNAVTRSFLTLFYPTLHL